MKLNYYIILLYNGSKHKNGEENERQSENVLEMWIFQNLKKSLEIFTIVQFPKKKKNSRRLIMRFTIRECERIRRVSTPLINAIVK